MNMEIELVSTSQEIVIRVIYCRILPLRFLFSLESSFQLLQVSVGSIYGSWLNDLHVLTLPETQCVTTAIIR